jgi:hypothetical protein
MRIGFVGVGRMMMKPVVGVGVAADALFNLPPASQTDAPSAAASKNPRACLIPLSSLNDGEPTVHGRNSPPFDGFDCRLKLS